MPKTVVRSLRMSPELWAFVAQRAQQKGLTVNAWITLCIEVARKRLANGKSAD